MNFFEKRHLYLLILIITSSTNPLKGDAFDDSIDEATTNLIEPTGPKVKKIKHSSSIDILLQLLTGNIDQILARNFYQKTFTPLKRPVTTLPIFNLYHTDHICQNWLFNMNFFFDKTDRAFYTFNSPYIETLVDVDPDTLRQIEQLAAKAPQILGLFRRAKKEERRLGVNLEYLKNFYEYLSLELKTAFLYEERNVFLTPEEIEEVKKLFPGGEKQQEKEFQKHVIADKIGFDDLKVKLGCLVLEKDNLCIKVGAQSTIPTAFAFKKGILGSNFLKIAEKSDPQFSFFTIFDLLDKNDTTALTEYTKNFGFEVVDRLSGIAFDSQMGNDGHFGLGCFIEPKIKVNEGVTLRTLASVEYFFPAKEKRYFLRIKNPADFPTFADTKNEQLATAAVNFLDQQVVETFFPPLFTTYVTPGFIAQFTIGPKFRLREWDFAFGYDFYYQHKEKINYIQGNSTNLYVSKGARSKAFQNTIFASIFYNNVKPDSDWSLLFNFEEALYSKGVGNNYTLSLCFESNY